MRAEDFAGKDGAAEGGAGAEVGPVGGGGASGVAEGEEREGDEGDVHGVEGGEDQAGSGGGGVEDVAFAAAGVDGGGVFGVCGGRCKGNGCRGGSGSGWRGLDRGGGWIAGDADAALGGEG